MWGEKRKEKCLTSVTTLWQPVLCMISASHIWHVSSMCISKWGRQKTDNTKHENNKREINERMNWKVKKKNTLKDSWHTMKYRRRASFPIYTFLTLLNKMAGRGHMIGYAQMPSSSSYWWKMSAGLIQGSMGLKKEVISGWEQVIYCTENACPLSNTQ